MKRSLFTLCALSSLSAAYGCGGARSPVVHTSPRADGASQESAPSASYSIGSTDKAARPESAPGARSESSAQRERSGLGTEWGETRDSRITHSSFEREDATRPWSMLSVQYNDRTGIANKRDLVRNDGGELSMGRGYLSVSIRDDRDGSFDTFTNRDRGFVVGRVGDAYTIVVTNRSSHRFEVVASVDGLDVIDGKTADLDHRGYIMRPYGEVRIDGFRQSMNTVAAFRFGAVADSYAAQTGSARNVGVIGVAVFAERGDRWNDPDDQYLRDSANPFPGGFAKPPRR